MLKLLKIVKVNLGLWFLFDKVAARVFLVA